MWKKHGKFEAEIVRGEAKKLLHVLSQLGEEGVLLERFLRRRFMYLTELYNFTHKMYSIHNYVYIYIYIYT